MGIDDPLVSLRGSNSVSNITASTVEPIAFETVYYGEKVSYNRKSYFFELSEEDLQEANTWEIHTLQTLDINIYGAYPLPRRVLDASTPLRAVIVADLDAGQEGQHTFDAFRKMEEKDYDFVLHVGDFAYDINNDNGQRGDRFFEQMSNTITTRIPYMISGGNHEQINNGTMLQYRFKMPGCGDRVNRRNYYYSFNLKNVHFI